MRVLLDACVLVPTGLRHILLSLAKDALYTPLWSREIFEEWHYAHHRIHPEDQSLKIEQALLKDYFPHAMIEYCNDDTLSLPDENDAHVLYAARAGRAEKIITLNLRDFPRTLLKRYEITPLHPDLFLLQFIESPMLDNAIQTECDYAQRATGQNFTEYAFLKKLALPRLAKARKLS